MYYTQDKNVQRYFTKKQGIFHILMQDTNYPNKPIPKCFGANFRMGVPAFGTFQIKTDVTFVLIQCTPDIVATFIRL